MSILVFDIQLKKLDEKNNFAKNFELIKKTLRVLRNLTFKF